MSEQGRIIYRSPNHPDLQIREEAPPAAVYVPPLSEPTPAEMAVSVTQAAGRWIAAGFPVVAQAEYDARSAACEPCPFWDGAARLGFGKCKAPGCGCTKLKRWLATEECRHPDGSRWPKSE
jgi:hypothetical protein